MPVGIFEIESSAFVHRVELPFFHVPEVAAEGDAASLDPCQNLIEFFIADKKRIMVTFEVYCVIEIQGQRIVNPNWSEMARESLIVEAEDVGKKRAADSLLREGTMV